MKSISIVSEQTSGLAADSRIIAAALSQPNFETKVRKVGLRRVDSLMDRIIPQTYWKLFPNKLPHINLFCEQIFENWLNAANTNILIPNQEWCRPATLELLPSLDKILCKTRYAEDIFNNMGHNATYIGFTSEDHYDKNITKNYRKFLHVAGKSLQKGTVPIARTWSKHPEWPSLTIVTHNPALISEYFAPNIIVESPVHIERLWFLQNECGVHLCPSEAEGFGHVINEALACGAVVVTTAAPPMNELVGSDCGFLVKYRRTALQSLGTNYYIDEESLACTVNLIIQLNDEKLESMGHLARARYIKSKLNFELCITEIIAQS